MAEPAPEPSDLTMDQPNPNPNPSTTESNTESKPDSESDSDSDSEDEAELESQLKTLESELSRNPSNYDSHFQYIKLLRKMGELEKLRAAREAMSVLFPLTPQMWQDWAKDELTMSSPSETVEKLYERGVSDYLSVPLWCDYLDFIQEHDPSIQECSAAGLSKARNVFERALTAAGLHFSGGSNIWEAYNDFEQAIYLTIDETDVEGKEKQIQRIRNLYQRQLTVPLADMKSTLLAYKMWEVKQGNELDVNSDDLNGISPHVASAYKKALEMYNVRIDLEEQILKQDMPAPDRLALFKRYLKFEESAGDPARVQILYERAVAEFPIASDIWLDYTRYLDKTLKVGDVVKNVINRAARNCPWVGELWVRHLLSLERTRASEEDISLVFETALQCTFSSYEEYLDLFLTRIDGLRRRISMADQMQVLDYAVIRDTFQRASDYLSPQLKGSEALLRLHAYWARLELILANDIIAARGAWESLLKISGTMLEAWQRYISMEIEKGNLNEARSIYRRCYTKKFPDSGSEDICQLWLRFEREFGTLDDYDTAVIKVSGRLEELLRFRLKQESKAVATSEAKEQPSKKVNREKRKSESNVSEDQTPSKRRKDTSDPATKLTKKDQGEEHNVDKMEVKGAGERVSKVEKRPDPSEKRPMLGKPRFTDQCTAFISNLNLDATTDQLQNFFRDTGGVQSVRILKDKYTGKSRGLAYVDFSDDEHLNAALRKNKTMFLKRRVSIARSDPGKSKKHSSAHGNADKDGSSKESDQARSKPNVSSQPSNPSANQSSSKTESGDDKIQFKGKATFAVPRNVQTAKKTKAAEGDDETPKSNSEFREMFLKK